MKHFTKLFKLLTCVMAMVALGSTNAYASSSKTYYSKAVVTSTGNGKVYVGTSESAPTDDKYQETSEAINSASSTGNNASVSFYLFAQPGSSTTKFDGWYDNEDCTGSALSTENPYNAKITSNATKQDNAVTKNYYAKFIEATAFYSSTVTASCVGEGGTVAVSTETGNEDFGAEKSASNLNDVEAAHTYYLQAKPVDAEVYRFVGWYSDEACETQLSKNANYTYKVTAESTDEAAPTQFHAYAKFEAIPYFYSKMTATAVGSGKVNVSATSTAGEYEATSELSQKVADKASHTFYLKATPDADVLFDGWYADEECTELISNAASYAYNVAECSADEAAPTTVSVYAKFVPVDLYQFANAGFEKWETVTYSNKSCEEPLNWSSFLDATGNMKGMGANKQIEKSTDVREGATGYSARVYASSPISGVVAQGNLTNGCINMGSMTATDASGNYNYINEARADQAMRFEGRPDAVKVWAKYKGYDATYNKGNISIILTTKGFYQDPLANASKITATKVAHASFPEVESNDEWTLYTIPFEYYTDDVPYYSLATLSTNATPGKGNKSDYLFVDDIEMVYNSAEMKSAEFDGAEITFVDGVATVDAAYDEEKLVLVSNAAGAIIEKNYDEATGLLTIVVKGGDYGINPSNKYEYSIQFAAAGQEATLTENLYVTINNETTGPQETDVVVNLHADNSFDFVLKNFMLDQGDGNMMAVGNIKVMNLTLNPDYSFAFNGNINIEKGDAEGVEEEMWAGPMLGEVPLDMKGQFTSMEHVLVSIDIDMMASIGQIIAVHLGFDAANLAINATAKYGTFCAPFNVEVPEGVTAYTVDGVNSETLQLTEVSSIEAHTPVIVYGEFEENANLYQFGVAVEGDPTGAYLNGTYKNVTAPVGSYVLQNHDGVVGFYKVEDVQPTVKANRAYLTVPEGSEAKVFTFGEATAIEAVEALTAGKAQIYDLNGRQLKKLQKGINIVNGVKVLVK